MKKSDVREFLEERLRNTYIPTSVYRVQMNSDFNFRDTLAIANYLRDLGIDALYASPYFESTPGSRHGYDVLNSNRINPEIGSEEDYAAYCDGLESAGLHQIIDVVPNHMGIRGGNPIWEDVLENGPSSLCAKFFDINWDPEKKELQGKVLLPILGNPYGRVLESGELKLHFTGREFQIRYYGDILPLAPSTYPSLLQSGIDSLNEKLGNENEDVLELLSIATAFRNLPVCGGDETQKMYERNREKEISKNRLETLCKKSEEIRKHIENAVRQMNGKKGKPESFNALHELLDAQSYCLAFWRVASEEINYRRFFDINELAAIRIENKDVFEEHHRLVFELIQRGVVQGLRIDHPDGLYDPPEYFRRIQRRYVYELLSVKYKPHDETEQNKLRAWVDEIFKEEEFREARPLYVVVEKILDREELLPGAWKVHGTVGYEYLNTLNGLFVKQTNDRRFKELYDKFIGHSIDFDRLIYDKKKFFALIHMASEMNNLGHLLSKISEKHRHYRDFTLNNLILAIREVMACFPVYRTYISPEDKSVSSRDERYILEAINAAKKRTPALPSAVYHFLREVLLLRLEADVSEEEREEYREFNLRFQQLTGPIMAKGLEDTAFYVYNRLLSLNEVGGDPMHFGCDSEYFHEWNARRNHRWPASILCASTHDSKRSEDVRMRLNVLSEIPEEWENQIDKWSRMNEKYRTLLDGMFEPKRNTEYFIYQTLLGVWPDESLDAENFEVFRQRIWQYMEKAVREAKIYTNWVNPDAEYEGAVKSYIEGILSSPDNAFLADFSAFQKKISFYGKLNALSALALRLGSPGVLDVYRGNEIWDYNLVDPDNRRPVDYDKRRQILGDLIGQSPDGFVSRDRLQEMTRSLGDSRLKMFLLWRGLQCRKRHAKVFVGGVYRPLKLEGKGAESITAFMRSEGAQHVIVIAARFFTALYPQADDDITRPAIWRDTAVILPEEGGSSWHDLLTGEEIIPAASGGKKVSVSEILHSTDFTILESRAKA